ncbi:hypothetical protein CRYUN_Cryun32bG0061400 [Craigia yunnanensis]
MRYGRVLDFYIPLNRRNPRRSKFGFFRFKDLRETLSVIRALDGSRWYEWILNVNLAKYEWKNRNFNKVSDSNLEAKAKKQSFQNQQTKKGDFRVVVSNHQPTMLNHKPSYAEVLSKTESDMGSKDYALNSESITFETDDSLMEELQKRAVAEVKNPQSIQFLQ